MTQSCVWPFAWHKYKPLKFINTSLVTFLPFRFASQREGEVLTVAQWINLNKSMLVCWYPILWEKTGLLLPLLVCLSTKILWDTCTYIGLKVINSCQVAITIAGFMAYGSISPTRYITMCWLVNWKLASVYVCAQGHPGVDPGFSKRGVKSLKKRVMEWSPRSYKALYC